MHFKYFMKRLKSRNAFLDRHDPEMKEKVEHLDYGTACVSRHTSST